MQLLHACTVYKYSDLIFANVNQLLRIDMIKFIFSRLPAKGEPSKAAAPINSNSRPKTLFNRFRPNNSTAIIGRNAAKQAKSKWGKVDFLAIAAIPVPNANTTQ